MPFSEFQYSNRQAFPFTVPAGTSGETWTKEEAVSGIAFRDKVESGRQLTVTIRNPQNLHGSKYHAFQRVRVIDRPSNAILFIGRIQNAQNNHRKQILVLTCVDYVGDLGDKTVPSANLYGNRRSDITKDVISGGIEQGRTKGIAGSLNRIFDSNKKFTKKYEGRVVNVAGRGPGLVTVPTITLPTPPDFGVTPTPPGTSPTWGGTYITGTSSDRRLKENIELVGKSFSGINVYQWNYKSYPGKRYQGVMADEVPNASVVMPDGYLAVDYSKVDVDFVEV